VLLDALLVRLMLVPILLRITGPGRLAAAEMARPAPPPDVRFGH
jgi:hypothetical protein